MHSKLTPLLALALVPFAAAQTVDPKLEGVLPTVLAEAASDALLPVTIVLTEQVPREELQQAAATLSKVERRAYVTTRLKETASQSQAGLLAALESHAADGRAANVRPLWLHNVVGARVTPDVVKEIAQRADVAYVHYDAPRGEEVLVSMPSPVAAPASGPGAPTCGLNLINAPQVWSQTGITGSGVVVGVIDTGLCTTHSDIANQVWENPCEIPGNGVDDDGNGFVDDINGWNFESNNSNISDFNSHGSHVAGTVAGDGTGGTQCGVAPDARIMMLKFFNSLSGEQSVWDGMQYGVDNGADILTASLGWAHAWNPDRPTWRALCDNAIAAGVIVIYAAGNEGGGTQYDNVRTPGDVPDVLTVGAVDCGNNIAGFSSRGPVTWQNVNPYNDHPFPPGLTKPDVCAEGASTVSHSICSGYKTLAGTSMATPHVAGAVALLLQADPTLDQFGVKAILEGTALDLGAAGKDNSYGSGRIDALAAVQAAISGGNFCAPKMNSCGEFPVIQAYGHPSATSTSGYVVQATNVPGQQVGLLIYGNQGPANTPILGGFLCVSSFNRAVPVVDTVGTAGQCDGLLSIDMNAFRAGLLGGSPKSFLSIPGTTVEAQFWARDPANSFGALLTAGHRYTVCP